MKLSLLVAGLVSVAALDCSDGGLSCCITSSDTADRFCKSVEDDDIDMCASHSCGEANMCCSLDGSNDPGSFHCCEHGCTPCTKGFGETDCLDVVDQVNKCSAPPEVTNEYKRIKKDSDCCRENGAQIGSTEDGSSKTPDTCEAGCDALEECSHFSHSTKYDICVFCSKCDYSKKTSAKKYTSWKKMVPTPEPTSQPTQEPTEEPTKEPTTSEPTSEPTEEPDYTMIKEGSDCCRDNEAQIGNTKDKSSKTPDTCEAGCDALEECSHFSHSTKYGNCVFCSKCDYSNAPSAKKYTSWQKNSLASETRAAVDAEDGSNSLSSWLWYLTGK